MSDEISRRFAELCAEWELELPAEDVWMRRSGELTGRGWGIQYRFGSEGGREYIEVFAAHRMTNDRLYRVHEDGESEMVFASLDLCSGLSERTRDLEQGFRDMVRARVFEVYYGPKEPDAVSCCHRNEEENCADFSTFMGVCLQRHPQLRPDAVRIQ